jgi:transposase
MFQPSHAPETNPIERVWLHLKQGLRWQLPKTLNELQELQALVTHRLKEMTQQVISLTGRASILEALSVAGI